MNIPETLLYHPAYGSGVSPQANTCSFDVCLASMLKLLPYLSLQTELEVEMIACTGAACCRRLYHTSLVIIYALYTQRSHVKSKIKLLKLYDDNLFVCLLRVLHCSCLKASVQSARSDIRSKPSVALLASRR